MNTAIYIKNPVGQMLEQMNEEFIQDNIDLMEEYWFNNIAEGVNKDNVEAAFDRWLEDTDYSEKVDVIRKATDLK